MSFTTICVTLPTTAIPHHFIICPHSSLFHAIENVFDRGFRPAARLSLRPTHLALYLKRSFHTTNSSTVSDCVEFRRNISTIRFNPSYSNMSVEWNLSSSYPSPGYSATVSFKPHIERQTALFQSACGFGCGKNCNCFAALAHLTIVSTDRSHYI